MLHLGFSTRTTYEIFHHPVDSQLLTSSLHTLIGKDLINFEWKSIQAVARVILLLKLGHEHTWAPTCAKCAAHAVLEWNFAIFPDLASAPTN